MYIDIKLIELAGFVSALQALRLPYGLECRSLTQHDIKFSDTFQSFFMRSEGSIDDKDEDLLKSLIKRGDEHAKVIRGIVAYVDSHLPTAFAGNLFAVQYVYLYRLTSFRGYHAI